MRSIRLETIGQNVTSGRKARAIQFVELDTGCYVPLNFKLNSDGYFRKRWSSTEIEMFHRFIFKARGGEIPDGYEINHICRNRACQNITHFECIPGSEHAIKTNKQRYRHEKLAAMEKWLATGCKPSELFKEYGWRAYGWVREWNKGVV
jgi:HNH endonuclease